MELIDSVPDLCILFTSTGSSFDILTFYQQQNMARDQFRILEVKGLCNQCSENKGAVQLHDCIAQLICTFVFA